MIQYDRLRRAFLILKERFLAQYGNDPFILSNLQELEKELADCVIIPVDKVDFKVKPEAGLSDATHDWFTISLVTTLRMSVMVAKTASNDALKEAIEGSKKAMLWDYTYRV